jgi:hypothetical protein
MRGTSREPYWSRELAWRAALNGDGAVMMDVDKLTHRFYL